MNKTNIGRTIADVKAEKAVLENELRCGIVEITEDELDELYSKEQDLEGAIASAALNAGIKSCVMFVVALIMLVILTFADIVMMLGLPTIDYKIAYGFVVLIKLLLIVYFAYKN